MFISEGEGAFVETGKFRARGCRVEVSQEGIRQVQGRTGNKKKHYARYQMEPVKYLI
jgi:hypothetical protein